jgi:cytochrome c-type biogenesis protein CcmH
VIGFWIVAGLLTLAALVTLLRPLIRQRQPGAEDGEPVSALYRRQLAAIDDELAQARLTSEQAAAARTEITRRMLAAAERAGTAPALATSSATEASWRVGAALGIASLLPVAAIAVYVAVGMPAAIDRSAETDAAVPHGEAELSAAADRIKAHLQRTPGDLEGWTLLGRTLASLSRFPEAREAYAHAIALAPGETRFHAELGEVMVLEAEGRVTPAAEVEFAKAPDDPRARYYSAEAALQHGDTAEATQKLRALLADAPPDAAWRQTVADRLAELSSGRPPARADGAAPQSGPSAQDVAAAQSMSPEQRQAMIRGMVDRLAQRLEQNPGDKAGWARLARAYDVLGEPDKAAAARARAAAAVGTGVPGAPTQAALAADPGAMPADAQGWIARARTLEARGRTADTIAALKQGTEQFPGNLALLRTYMNALASGITDDRPSSDLVDVAKRVNALDGNDPDALWYLGLAAAQRGDGYRAAGYWTKLRDALPADDSRRGLLQRKLDALR